MPRLNAELQSFVGDVRRDAGISQAKLGKRIGVSRQTIVAIERGDYNPSTLVALRLANVLRVPVERLFVLTEEDIREIDGRPIT